MSSSHDFFIHFAFAKVANPTLTSEELVASANAAMGMSYSLDGDLYLRCKAVMPLIEAYHTAQKKPEERRELRRDIRNKVQTLYPDLCAEHIGWVHDAVANACKRPIAKSDSLNHRLSCYAETCQKWILKTGCSECAIQMHL